MSKRGSVYQRGDGRWCAAALVNGKRRSFYAITKDAADKKLTAWLAATDEGKVLPAARETVSAFLDRWLAFIDEEGRLRQRTRDTYRRHVNAYLKPQLGSIKLAKLTAEDVAGFLAERKPKMRKDEGQGSGGRQVKKLSLVTMRGVLRTLRIALRQAKRWRLVSENAAGAELVDAPRGGKKEARCFTPEEVAKILPVLERHSLGAVLLTMMGTGTMPSEVFGLEWRRVDLEGATMEVVAALDRVRGEDGKLRPVLAPLKTAYRARKIDLPPQVVDALRAQRLSQKKARLLYAKAWAKAPLPELVFTTPRGRPLDYGTVNEALREVLGIAGVAHATAYAGRHSFAALLMLGGFNLKDIADRLGHSSTAMVGSTYGHVMRATQRATADAIGSVLAKKGGTPA